jgi:hypothetical protein
MTNIHTTACTNCRFGFFTVSHKGHCRHPSMPEHFRHKDDCCRAFEADDPEKLKDFAILRGYLRAKGAGELFSRLHDYTYQSPPVTPLHPTQGEACNHEGLSTFSGEVEHHNQPPFGGNRGKTDAR